MFEEFATLVVLCACTFVAGWILGSWITERALTAMIREHIRNKGKA
jgi:uncharacterized protein YneF (UPF0154 family)